MPDVLTLNEPAPDFALKANDGSTVRLSDFQGKSNVLVFFYPADFTPVCTAEVSAFRDDYTEFEKRNVVLLGISADSVEKHERFSGQCSLQFPLLSDEGMCVAEEYGAKGLLGMRRAYYLIGIDGMLLWQHAEVLPIFKMSNARLIEKIDPLLSRRDHATAE